MVFVINMSSNSATAMDNNKARAAAAARQVAMKNGKPQSTPVRPVTVRSSSLVANHSNGIVNNRTRSSTITASASKTSTDRNITSRSARKVGNVKPRHPLSRSQESLDLAEKPAPRRKASAPPPRSAVGLRVLQEGASRSGGIRSRVGLTNMQRSSSKDSVDSKENVEDPDQGQEKAFASALAVTVMQMGKEKSTMKQQISELVRNAESKKAEIATLKMELNRLKEKQCEEDTEHIRQQLETLKAENRSLKERLLDMGVPLEQTSLSDSEKEQLLLRRSASGSMASLESERKECCNCLFNKEVKGESQTPDLEAELGEASGTRSGIEWDKASTSSLSEMSVACLQDRIMQMEENHYSTNEELQATLQELADLQDQLTDLQMDNERMSEDKNVLLESLCSQTEKLEECRAEITQLKELMFQQFEGGEGMARNASEKEMQYVELLKKAHKEKEMMLKKHDEMNASLNMVKDVSLANQVEQINLQDRIILLESTVDSVNADKRMSEKQLSEAQELLSANQIELNQLKMQLECEQQKVQELQRQCEANATSELETLLREARKDKERIDEKSMHLQEQLALSQREANRLKEQLSQSQEESLVAKNNAKKHTADLEYKIEQLVAEKAATEKQVELLEDALHQVEVNCQRHLEDKREMKAAIGEMQKTIVEKSNLILELTRDLEEARLKHGSETEEWKKFQDDLLTTVRVANDFKTEAQESLEKCLTENKQLHEKLETLEVELGKAKAKQEATVIRSPSRSNSASYSASSDPAVISAVERDLQSARRQLSSSKWGDHRGANQMSVKSLIESIENATKFSKGQGLGSSRSSSTSSLNSIASESRTSGNSVLIGNSGELFIKPRPQSADSAFDSKASSLANRIQKSVYTDSCNSMQSMFAVKSNNAAMPSENGAKASSENDSNKPHPMSILASKLDPIRRNSYGCDLVEKKDPLASLVTGGGSKRNALLKWCQNKTLGYKGIDITNFSSSWNDGLAFCALIHSYLPDLIPFHTLDNKDKRRNFTVAFQATESVGIQTTLNINDLISQERPDWQSIMTYVTSVYKHFET